jgi:hypothetical protein
MLLIIYERVLKAQHHYRANLAKPYRWVQVWVGRTTLWEPSVWIGCLTRWRLSCADAFG